MACSASLSLVLTLVPLQAGDEYPWKPCPKPRRAWGAIRMDAALNPRPSVSMCKAGRDLSQATPGSWVSSRRGGATCVGFYHREPSEWAGWGADGALGVGSRTAVSPDGTPCLAVSSAPTIQPQLGAPTKGEFGGTVVPSAPRRGSWCGVLLHLPSSRAGSSERVCACVCR